MKHVRNSGGKLVNARSLKGHWYSFKAGQLQEVEDEDVKHLVKRENLAVEELSAKHVKAIEEKKKEKGKAAKNKAEKLDADMRSARGKIIVG